MSRFNKAAIGCLLTCLILLLDAMAVAPSLHELLHQGSANAGHECAVTLFAKGKVESTTVDIPLLVTTIHVISPPPIESSVFTAFVELLPLGRAPPASAAIS